MSRQEFLETIVTSMGCVPDLLSQRGVTVAGSPSRAESQVSSGYVVGDHLLITCDPAVEEMLTEASAGLEPTLRAWEALALARGGEMVGAGRMQVLRADLQPAAALPAGYTLRSFDRSVEADVALVADLIAVSDADDLDEAEIEIDSLDEIVEVIVDASGAIASYASSIDFDMGPRFGDIGIMTRSDCRGLGLASIAVTAVSHRIIANGQVPLYRCDEDNTASIALSAALGFTIATQLIAFRFPT